MVGPRVVLTLDKLHPLGPPHPISAIHSPFWGCGFSGFTIFTFPLEVRHLGIELFLF